MAALAGCSGFQSALDPAGEESEKIATLFWVMAGGAGAIWLAVMAVLVYAARERRRTFGERAASRLIFWAGVVFPAVTLFALLAYALWLMPGLRPAANAGEPGGMTVEVTGRQYWWRVVYDPDGPAPVVSANEIRLPVGKRVHFRLIADDVIHSFWIPALGGKTDMIPGRVNTLSLAATKPGTYGGICAEFCGTSHALMGFSAIAMQPAGFATWLQREAAPAHTAGGDGLALFLKHGCGACHAIRGTQANGAAGPDLSHLGSRTTLAAGMLPNTAASIARFIADPASIKPGAHMPGFAMLPHAEIAAIASYLKALE